MIFMNWTNTLCLKLLDFSTLPILSTPSTVRVIPAFLNPAFLLVRAFTSPACDNVEAHIYSCVRVDCVYVAREGS